jgi:hypothetical protein
MEVQTKVAATVVPITDAPYYVRGLALGILTFLVAIHMWTWIFMLPTFLGGRADFRQLYTAGYMVRTGHARELYDYNSQLHFQNQLVSRGDIPLPFIRPAYQALLFVPFSRLGYRAAYFAFLAFNLILLGISFRLLRPGMRNLAKIYSWLPAAMFLGYLPIAAALMQGQDSVLLLTLLVWGAVLLGRGREMAAGVLVGLGLFKFQIVLPIALLFLLWRRWRFSAGFAFSAIGTGAISLWLVGIVAAKIYLRSLLAMGAGLAARADLLRYPIPVEAMANLRGLIFGLAGNHLSHFWIQAVTSLASAIVLGLVAAWRFKERGGGSALAVAITASAVVSYYLLIHDLSILLIPIVVTLDRFIGAEANGDKFGRLVARASALMFVAPICFSYMPDHFYLVALPLLAFLVAILAASARTSPLEPA